MLGDTLNFLIKKDRRLEIAHKFDNYCNWACDGCWEMW